MLGAGADDLILLCARAFAGPGRHASRSPTSRRTRSSASPPGSPAPRSATTIRRSRSAAGRTTRPARSASCPTRGRSSSTRRTSSTRARRRAGLIDDGVIVLRTFSKAFGLAGARVGYALADAETAAELNARQAPLPGLDALRGARARRARAPPDVGAGRRGARAARERAPRARARAAAVARELPLRAGRRAARRSAPRCCARARRARLPGRASASPCATARTTTCCSRRSRARSTGRRRSRAAGGRRARHLRATAETRIRVRLALDGAGRVRVATGAGPLRPPARAARLPRRLRPRARGRRRPRDRRAPHRRGRGARARRGARPRARRPPRHRALRRRRRADGRRARPRRGRPRRPAVGRAHARARPRPRRPRARQPRAGGAASRSTSRRPAATTHHVAEAAFKAVGRALRAAVRPRAPGSRRRRACCEGRVCDYGAGNVRSVVLAFARLGAQRRHRRRRAAPTSPSSPASARPRARWRRSRERGLDEALRDRVADGRPMLGICLGLQLALEESEEDGGVAGLGLLPGRACGSRGPRAAHRLGARSSRAASAFYFAHSYAAETPRATAYSEGLVAEARARLVPRRPVPPREERRRGRALPGAMPLPRLIPCLDVAGGRVVKGVRFAGLRDVGDPVELGAALLRRGRRRARLPRRQGDARGPRRRSSSSSRGSPSASRSRSRSAAASARVADAEALLAPAPTRSPSTRRRSRGPS